MKKTDIQCPECAAGYRRIELVSTHGEAGVYRANEGIWIEAIRRGLST